MTVLFQCPRKEEQEFLVYLGATPIKVPEKILDITTRQNNFIKLSLKKENLIPFLKNKEVDSLTIENSLNEFSIVNLNNHSEMIFAMKEIENIDRNYTLHLSFAKVYEIDKIPIYKLISLNKEYVDKVIFYNISSYSSERYFYLYDDHMFHIDKEDTCILYKSWASDLYKDLENMNLEQRKAFVLGLYRADEKYRNVFLSFMCYECKCIEIL